jgi:Sulfotransferase domain
MISAGKDILVIKIIGAGFGRTGTASLQLAMQQLGFGPCYHMKEIFHHPGDADRWISAYAGNPVDWRELFAGYQATMDFPGCMFWRN